METHRPHILIVDDSATARRQLRKQLADHGVDATEANEGIEGLWRAREQVFDLVITDVHMPAMDGLAFIKELRGIKGYERTPVFVLSSDRSAERMRAARKAGASAWIVKPADVALVAAAIRRAVSDPRISGPKDPCEPFESDILEPPREG